MIFYDAEPELETYTLWVCSVDGCKRYCMDEAFANSYGCAEHGDTWIRVVRQYENGVMVSEFRQRPND